MANNNLTFSGKIKVIIDGIIKLSDTNKPLFWFLVVISVLSFLQNVVSKNDFSSFQSDSGAINNIGSSEMAFFTVFAILFLIPFLLVLYALFVFFYGMISYATLQASKGKSIDLMSTYQATKERFWTLFAIVIIVSLKILGGLLLFIVPGVRALCRYYVVFFVAFDKNLSARKTIEYCKKETKNQLTIPFLAIVASAILTPISYVIQFGALTGYYPLINKSTKEK